MGACASISSSCCDSFIEEKNQNEKESDIDLTFQKHSSLRKFKSVFSNNLNFMTESASQKYASFPYTTNQSLDQLVSSTTSSLFSLCEHYLEIAVMSSPLDYLEMSKILTLPSVPLQLESDENESSFTSLEEFSNNHWIQQQEKRLDTLPSESVSLMIEEKRSEKVSLDQEKQRKCIPLLKRSVKPKFSPTPFIVVSKTRESFDCCVMRNDTSNRPLNEEKIQGRMIQPHLQQQALQVPKEDFMMCPTLGNVCVSDVR
ncbi:hypothetical protein FDP41_001883 [Naegleria fowleri]|uniref:Uncharacterized protein n=1 Tax=Naegleria fowleri TaxID=5763 RepID=A0A6A5BLC7_NAEFO|nr:uncharacterized protein FDP41_001883 [Naegleria fowleri]KAF0978813.1 hypothetical protein FDP41_001883 [Naegleria fowleri]